MAEPAQPPPRIRMIRPYDSEEAFLSGDLNRLGRLSVILPDAPSYPVGTVVRFEVALPTGAMMLRGEGPVSAFHPPAGPKPPGLEVRIARFDAHTKSVLEAAYARRAASRSMAAPSATSLGPAVIPATSIGPPVSLGPAGGTDPSRAIEPNPTPVDTRQPVELPKLQLPKERPSGVRNAPRSVDVPSNRDEILERLRVRARSMRQLGGLTYKSIKS